MYPKGPLRLMFVLYRHIFPEVKRELARWKAKAENIPDPELRKQALNSIHNKNFHCEGGAVYAATNLSQKKTLIRLIVAYQTISDYLDNLCDRSTTTHSDNFYSLHQALLDAVSLQDRNDQYYAYNLEKEDGGYLQSLVHTCHDCIRQLPNYEKVRNKIFLLE